jgi:hypothetical protein
MKYLALPPTCSSVLNNDGSFGRNWPARKWLESHWQEARGDPCEMNPAVTLLLFIKYLYFRMSFQNLKYVESNVLQRILFRAVTDREANLQVRV